MSMDVPVEMMQSLAENRLVESGFLYKNLADLDLPNVQSVEAMDGSRVSYAIFGNPTTAKILMFSSVAYSTNLRDGSEMVHFAAQQEALGEEACVIGVQVYDPKNSKLDKAAKETVATGSFEPFAERLLAVIEKVNPKQDQEIVLHGYSMGADVAVETGYQAVTNPNKGQYNIERLGAFECARAKQRGRLAMMATFMTSGPELYENVTDSISPALLEARHINLRKNIDSRLAKQKHDLWVAKNVLGYYGHDLRGNMSLVNGFGTDTSLRQLNIMASNPNSPLTVVGRGNKSKVCPPEFLDGLDEHEHLQTVTFEGDHSASDKLQNSVMFAMITAIL